MKTLLFTVAMALTASVGFIAGANMEREVTEERLQKSLHSEEFVIDVNMDGSIHGEPVEGGVSGEGVFLDEYDAEELTHGMWLEDGDVIRVYWLKIDAYAEEWEHPVAVTRGAKQ